MKSLVFGVLAACLLVGAGFAAPLEVYGRLPAMRQVEISPDGTKIAYIAELQGAQRVIVHDLKVKKAVASVNGGKFNIRSIQWADNGNLIVISSRVTGLPGIKTPTLKDEYLQGVVLSVADNQVTGLLHEGDQVALYILRSEPKVRRLDGVTRVFIESVAFIDSVGASSIFRSDIGKRRTVLVEAGEPTTYDWLLDKDGQIIGRADFSELTGLSQLRLRARGALRVLELPAGASRPYFVGLGRSGDTVLVGYDKDEKNLLAEVSLETFAWSEPLADTELEGVVFDPATHQPIGHSTLAGDLRTYSFFAARDQAAWRAVLEAFPGQSVNLLSMSDDHRKFVVAVDSPSDGLAYALVNLDAKTADWIGEAYVNLKPEDVSPVKAVSYKAADGLEITGYLTTPHGSAAKDLPLVVLPHGGPAARDTPGFDWWAQALASRGYAVLQPNFRGSDGFGRAFLEAGYGEWGKKMQTDLSDGVRHLAAHGVIDPKRVCIVGASYGGYAALAGATIDRGVYRCAVSVAGPSDLRRMLITDKRSAGAAAMRYWTRFMGVDGAADRDLSPITPSANADKVDIPLMLIHGKDDMIVLYEQSTIMAAALRRAGKPVELVTLEGEDHGLSRSETRLKMLQSTVAFLEKHNPPNPPAQTASLP